MTGRAIGTRLARAEAQSAAARARLSDSLVTLQRRATPRALAQDVAETLQARGIAAVNQAVETARRKPVAVGIVAAVVGLFLARRQIFRVFRRRGTPIPSPQRGSQK